MVDEEKKTLTKKEQKNFEPVKIVSGIVNDVDKFDLEKVEYDTLVQMGIEVSEVKTYSQWVLGKLGDAVAKKYGDLIKYSKEIRQKYEVLNQYMYVYRKFAKEDPTFTPQKYFGSVPWGVLQLAAYKSDSPQKLVGELQDEGAESSIESAHRAIQIKKGGKDIPHKPRFHFTWDAMVERYRLTFKKEDLELIDWTDVKQQLMDYLEALK